jgi:hypothetical protein
MSAADSALTLALGVGGGLAAWYVLRERKAAHAPAAPSGAPNPTAAKAPTRGGCALRLDPTGLFADGVRVAVPEAVERCKATGGADITVIADAPASTYAELMVALGRAGVPTHAHRNAGRARRARRNAERSSTFTLAVYPEGVWGTRKIVQSFSADPPTTWKDARDRLAAARLLDPSIIGPNQKGAWTLVTDPRLFDAARAKRLPGGTRDAARTGRYSLEGRTIVRDGEPLLHLERVDLGDERYAITPHAADVLAKQIVDLLNQQRRRRQGAAAVDVADLGSGGRHA